MRWYKDQKSGQIRSSIEWSMIAPDRKSYDYEEVCRMNDRWYNLNNDLIQHMDVDLATEVQTQVGNASDQEFLDQYRIAHQARFNSEFQVP